MPIRRRLYRYTHTHTCTRQLVVLRHGEPFGLPSAMGISRTVMMHAGVCVCVCVCVCVNLRMHECVCVCVAIAFALGKNVRQRLRHRIVELAMRVRDCVHKCADTVISRLP